MGNGTRKLGLSALAALAFTVAACAAAGSSPAGDYTLDNPKLTREGATALAETALAGWADCDYGRFSTSWDGSMLAAIPETAFKEFCAAYTAAHGKYLAIESIDKAAAQTSGHVKWIVKTVFEKGPVTYNFVLPFDSDRITGSRFDPPQ